MVVGVIMKEAYPYAIENRSGFFSVDSLTRGIKTFQQADPGAAMVPVPHHAAGTRP